MVAIAAMFGGNSTWTNAFNNSVGTSVYTLNGTGNITFTGAGSITNPLTINGTITAMSNFSYSTGTLALGFGSLNMGSYTLTIPASVTLNTDGIIFNSINVTTGTITNNSLLTCTTLNLASSGNITFTGTHGFTINALSIITAGRTITFKNGLTYLVNSSLVLTGTSGSRITLQSSTTSHAYLTLAYGATQSVTNCNATWINSGGGDTIKSSFGTLSNTVNWELGQGCWWLMQ
jgi:hypothetical protein